MSTPNVSSPDVANEKHHSQQDVVYSSGAAMSRFITPGGHPADNSQPALPVFHRKFANPAPLGLMGFGGTTLLLSLYNLSARGVEKPNVLVGVALMYGGVCQLICGIMEWACGNTFGTCAFTGYGAFWISWACINIPWFGITKAYEKNPNEMAQAIGLYLIVWGLVTCFLLLALLRSSIALCFTFFVVACAFFCLAAGDLCASHAAKLAGGGFGIAGGLGAMYVAVAGLLDGNTSYFTLPIGNLAPA